jgi:signal transduction histidine kinase
MDVILFLHPIPMIAVVGLHRYRPDGGEKFRIGTLDFLQLLAWWVFLYAFVVFPAQYVSLNMQVYDRNYNTLYLFECLVLVLVLGIAARGASAGWRMVYLNLMAASALYALDSGAVNLAMTDGSYYTGSLYDVPLVGAVSWMAATALTARQKWLTSEALPRKWQWGSRIAPRLAMLAILSLPALGLWTVLLDHSPAAPRAFRLYTVLAAMLVLGAFVFLRQYFQDQALMALLKESRQGYESQKHLQSQLVQKEKLASLGNLVAGAAHEIDHPLTAIMSYSEQLWAKERLTDEQNTLVRKIVNQARRTRDLVADLLSFAQQSPGEKIVVDLSVLLQRATQMLESRRAPGKIRVGLSIAPDFPRVHGNANQLFQTFVEIIENALDALEENGGGSLEITAHRLGQEAMLQFSDTGPGIRDPLRVFDPFYTTKPIGKGTGLGLSAVYGVIQDHDGQITCQNKSDGGALFIVRIPAAVESSVQVAGAGGS